MRVRRRVFRLRRINGDRVRAVSLARFAIEHAPVGAQSPPVPRLRSIKLIREYHNDQGCHFIVSAKFPDSQVVKLIVTPGDEGRDDYWVAIFNGYHWFSNKPEECSSWRDPAVAFRKGWTLGQYDWALRHPDDVDNPYGDEPA